MGWGCSGGSACQLRHRSGRSPVATGNYAARILKGKSRKACQAAIDQDDDGDQPQDRDSPRPHCASDTARARRRGDRIETDLLQCISPVVGTFETWRPALTISVSRGRPEAVGRRPKKLASQDFGAQPKIMFAPGGVSYSIDASLANMTAGNERTNLLRSSDYSRS